MTVVLFLLVHALKGLSSPEDSYWVVLYAGLDQLIVLAAWRLWLYTRR